MQYVTLTRLGTILGTSRTTVHAWLAGIGLLTLARQPSEKAIQEGFCKGIANDAVFLWHRHRTVAALRATYQITLATWATARSSVKKTRRISKQTLSFSCSKVMRYLRTPTDIWQDLSSEFRFSVDACASDANHLVDRYWTEREDGLKQDWTGEVVWCHPLFNGEVGRWVAKAAESRCTTVLLLPAATHTRYFHRYIYHNPRCEIRFLEKPPKGFRFGRDDGQPDDESRIGYIRPLMLVVFRNDLDDGRTRRPGVGVGGEGPRLGQGTKEASRCSGRESPSRRLRGNTNRR